MGKASKGPFKNIQTRFGKKKDAYIEQAISPTILTLVTKQKTLKKHNKEALVLTQYIKIKLGDCVGKVCIINDVMQTIEKSRYMKNYRTGESVVRTAHELYLEMKRFIVMAFQVEGCDLVILAPDACVNQNRAKEMTYYTEGAKRRLGVKPMQLKKEDLGKIIVDDEFAPSGSDWTSFKCNVLLRQQLNWYLGHKLMRDQQLDPEIPLLGHKRVIFDNFIKVEDVHKTNPTTINYQSVVLNYNNGDLVGFTLAEGSNISEGEVAIEYHVSNLSQTEEHKDYTYIAYTCDQDIIPITTIGVSKRQREGFKQPKAYFVAMRSRNMRQSSFFKFIDVLQLHKNIEEYHNHVPYAVEMEMFFFLLGGCDYSIKPFKGVGWEKAIYKEFITNPKKYYKMFSFSKVPIEATTSGEKDLVCDMFGVNPEMYKIFAFNVYKRKFSSNTYRKKFKQLNKNVLQVIPRQIMFNFLWTMNVVYLRIKEGASIKFNPLDVDKNGVSLWGYKEGKVENSYKDKVVMSSTSISMDHFIL